MSLNSAVELAFPSWFVTPSPFKDTTTLSGGQRQVRPSCKAPAAQTWPEEITDCEHSRWSDGMITSMDLDQGELRGVALLSGEPSMVNFYVANIGDLHSDRAIAAFGRARLLELCGEPLSKDNEAFKMPFRFCGKTANFSDAYKCGPKKLWSIFVRESKLYVPFDLVQKMVQDRTRLRPTMCDWQDELLDAARRYGRLTIPWIGVSRSFHIGPKNQRGEDKDDTCEACNFPVQALVAATLLDIQRYLHRILPWSSSAPVRMYKQVYDSLSFDHRITYRAELHHHIRNAVTWAETEGLWGRLQATLGRHVPLKYDTKPLIGAKP